MGAIGLLWTRNPGLGLGLAGAGVPLFLRRIGVDPAVVVTTFTDVFGFLLFLGIATAAISLLV